MWWPWGPSGSTACRVCSRGHSVSEFWTANEHHPGQQRAACAPGRPHAVEVNGVTLDFAVMVAAAATVAFAISRLYGQRGPQEHKGLTW